jgi:hypothetical protein
MLVPGAKKFCNGQGDETKEAKVHKKNGRFLKLFFPKKQKQLSPGSRESSSSTVGIERAVLTRKTESKKE